MGWGLVLVLVVAAGCGQQGPPADASDGGLDAGAPLVGDAASPDAGFAVDVAPPAAPASPALPVLTPCPTGWTEQAAADGGPATCEPASADGGDCPDGEAHFVDADGCTPIGDPCPTGTWPADLPASGVLYVQAGAAASGDGSRASPFATVGAALSHATPGTTVALSAGAFTGPFAVPQGVELRGACVAQTRITCTTDDYGVTLDAPGSAVRDLHIDGCWGGVWTDPGTSADYRIEGVLVTGVTSAGWVASSGTGTVGGFVVRDSVGDPTVEESGVGIALQSGAQATARHVVVERALCIGVAVLGASLDIADVAVRDTSASIMTNAYGEAIYAASGGTVQLARALVDGSRFAGIEADQDGSDLNAQDVVVRHTAPALDGRGGFAAYSYAGSTLELERASFEDNGSGLMTDAGSVTADDVVVRRDSGSPAFVTAGLGVRAIDAGSIDLARAFVEEAMTAGVDAQDPGTRLDADDLTVRATRSASDGTWGAGIIYELGAGGELDRALVQDTRATGVEVTDAGSQLRVSDLTIENTMSQMSDGIGAYGLGVLYGASLEADRVRIEQTVGIGLRVGQVANDPVSCVIRDLAVDGATSAPGYVAAADGTMTLVPDVIGGGIAVVGGHADLTRTDVGHGSIYGVGVGLAGSVLSATDVHIHDGDGRTGDGRHGDGLLALHGANVRVERARIEANRSDGVGVGWNSTVDLEHVLVADTASEPSGNFGTGVEVVTGSTATLNDVQIRDSHDGGLLAYGTTVSGTKVSVIDTQPQACAADGCDNPGGIGVGSYDNGQLELHDFLVAGNTPIGLQLAGGGTMDLRDGEVSSSTIGVNIATPGFDIARISDGVTYRENETTLDTDMLPVPTPGELPDLGPGPS